MEILYNQLNLSLCNIPSWYTGRLWLMRLGYYKLKSEKEKADDWVWIVDHSIQIGEEKCFVILGIRLCNLPKGRALKREDVEPIEMVPVKKSNGDVVYEQLESVANKTSIPRAIVADYGSDIKSGIEKFCTAHENTSYIYDVKHQMASLWKRELSKDEKWKDFISSANKAKLHIQQTTLAGLAPPKQRSKARYMNTEYLLGWGKNILRLLIQSDDMLKIKGLDANKVREKLGWVLEFKKDIVRWHCLLDIATITEDFIRYEGIYQSADTTLLKRLENLSLSDNTAVQFKEDVVKYVKNEARKARPNETLLGSSEIIESLFGKQKYIEKEQSNSGFTGLLLALPALVSKTTDEVIQKAMVSTPAKKVADWYKENIKTSVQSNRKKAFNFPKEQEQNLDQLIAAL